MPQRAPEEEPSLFPPPQWPPLRRRCRRLVLLLLSIPLPALSVPSVPSSPAPLDEHPRRGLPQLLHCPVVVQHAVAPGGFALGRRLRRDARPRRALGQPVPRHHSSDLRLSVAPHKHPRPRQPPEACLEEQGHVDDHHEPAGEPRGEEGPQQAEGYREVRRGVEFPSSQSGARRGVISEDEGTELVAVDRAVRG